MRFEDKVVMVTGAASGLGRATSVRLASEGATVLGVDLNADGLEETRALIADAGGAFTGHVGDISERASAAAVVDSATESAGGLDVLCNVAGVIRAAHTTEVTQADWDLVLKVNLSGTFWMCQAAIPRIIERRGNIVNIASNAGLMGQPYAAAYTASKAGVVNLTRSLACEYVREKIRINAVAPGGIVTPMTDANPMPDDADWELLQPIVGHRKMSSPDHIAAVVAFVASDDARAMHGSIVSADNGLTAA